MKYPAIAQFTGDDELEIIKTENELTLFMEVVQLECTLIDSDGITSAISRTPDNLFAITKTQSAMSAAEAVQLAQVHMAAQEHCCVAKFNAATVGEVIAAVVALED